MSVTTTAVELADLSAMDAILVDVANLARWLAVINIRVSIYFFFSSRRRHTRLQGDWSSDVCSSDLAGGAVSVTGTGGGSGGSVGSNRGVVVQDAGLITAGNTGTVTVIGQGGNLAGRLGEGRGGKEGRSRGAAYHLKKKKEIVRDIRG